MSDIVYLGDGLYAKIENMQVVLMANDPNRPSDLIYLEWPEVYENLVKFVEARMADYGKTEEG